MNPTEVRNTITDMVNSTNQVRYDNRQTGTSELGQDAFLQLLMTQMQYQNPLEPMSNQDMIAQQAQFSAVSELQKINSVLSSSNQFLQASSLIGKNVTLIDPDNPDETISGSVSEAKVGSDGIGIVLKDGEITYPLGNILSVKESTDSTDSTN